MRSRDALLLILLIVGLPVSFCSSNMVSVTKSHYGTTKDEKEVDKYTLTNKNGVEIDVITFGAITVSIKCPDRDGKIDDIVLGYDSLEGYQDNPPYFGSTIGRFSNRIANAKFTLDGKEYNVSCNSPPNMLHGGFIGFNKKLWNATMGGTSVTMSYVSADGEEGFPGEVHVSVEFSLSEDNEFTLRYTANTTKPTPINLTNHSYYNLAGQVTDDVLSHVLWIDADTYLPTNDVQIPTGEKRSVAGAPDGAFDFRKAKPIGQDINKITPPGYDHNMCVSQEYGLKARVFHPANGRVLEVYSDQPGLQLYTGNGLDGNIGKGGLHYKKYGAVCMEAENYPNAINEPSFPNSVLRPDKEYTQRTTMKISVQ